VLIKQEIDFGRFSFLNVRHIIFSNICKDNAKGKR
jgi:hypothetical protein